MYQRVDFILAMLAERWGHAQLDPTEPDLSSQEGVEAPSRSSAELPSSVVIQEYGTRFRIHFAPVTRRASFCDPARESETSAELCQGKNVLDLCCYSAVFPFKRLVLARRPR